MAWRATGSRPTVDEPGGFPSTTARQDVLVGRRVLVPELSLLVVGLADLPLLGRIVEPFLEATQLLLFRDVQVELEDVGVILDEFLLERVDLICTFRENLTDRAPMERVEMGI